MSLAVLSCDPLHLPDGFAAVPIIPDDHSPLRICILARKKADPVAGHLLSVRDVLDARVLIGCITDHQGRVHQWVEVWQQDPAALRQAAPNRYKDAPNALLDERWHDHVDAIEHASPTLLYRTGFEKQHPIPTFIDPQRMTCRHLIDEQTKQPWRLCCDDGLLSANKLPPYGGSVHRYLYATDEAENTRFVSTAPDAPTNDQVSALHHLLEEQGRLIPLNPTGGLMMVRAYSPVDLESFITVLGGGNWEGLTNGRTVLDLSSYAKLIQDQDYQVSNEGRMFLSVHGQWGRVIETFHLKLRLLRDMVHQVQANIQKNQRPLFNLNPKSFQVHMGDRAAGLPFLWTARAVLVDSGNALRLPIETGEMECFLPGEAQMSIYAPESASSPSRGFAMIRIRQVLDEGHGALILEGTLETEDRMRATEKDLIWLRFNLADQRVDIYARLETDAALASGEWRFRSIVHRFSEPITESLKSAEGIPMPDVPFQVVTVLSTPCDLYALGVLAVRTLLVDNKNKLSVALDEFMSLAKQVAAEHDPAVELPERIGRIFRRDRRWVESLGPQRLTHDSMTPADAFDLVPVEVWWQTLASVIRMFPGIGPDSTCRDWADARLHGLHRVFEQPARDLETLLVKTRSLIVIDWRFNREIHAVIRRLTTGLTPE